MTKTEVIKLVKNKFASEMHNLHSDLEIRLIFKNQRCWFMATDWF
jgi:hypothetical protein